MPAISPDSKQHVGPTPGKRTRHISDNVGEVVAEDCSSTMLDDITNALKRDPDLISQVWFLLKQGKLRRNADKTPKDKQLQLPKSRNKFDIVSKDRLELILKELEPTLDRNALKLCNKQSLCRSLCWAIHSEEDSAVPSKEWDEFAEGVSMLYDTFGRRLGEMRFRPSPSSGWSPTTL